MVSRQNKNPSPSPVKNPSNFILSSFFASTYLLISPTPVNAAPAPPSTGTEVFIKTQDVPLLEFTPGTRLEADVRNETTAWLRRVVIGPSLSSLIKTNPDLRDTLMDLGNGASAIAFDYPSFASDEEDRRSAARELEPVLAKLLGSAPALKTHPFIAWVAARIDRAGSHDWRRATDFIEGADKSPDLDTAPPALRFLMALTYLDAKQQASHWNKRILSQMLEKAAACADNPSIFNENEAEIALRILSRAFTDRSANHFPELCEKIASGKALPPWTREALLGFYEIKAAWNSRSGKWASKVSEQQWAGYRKHLDFASGHLTKSYELNPRSPIAADGMITVVMGGGGEGSLEDWLQRAVSAQFDFMPAYRSYSWAIRPRWGGSHEKMIAFALSCTRTQRFDTLVPGELPFTLKKIVEESGTWKNLFTNPLIAPALLEVGKGYADSPDSALRPEAALSNLVLYAWLGGHHDEAVEAFARLKGDFHSSMVDTAEFYGIDSMDLRGWLVLHRKGLGKDWEAFLADYKANRMDEAASKLDRLISNFSDSDPPALLRRMEQTLAVESRLASGGWAALPFTPGLEGWRVVSGDWAYGGDGNLVNRGHDKPGVILNRARVGKNFELQGRFKVTGKGTCCHGAGIAIGHNGLLGDDAAFVTCAASQYGKSELQGRVLGSFSQTDKDPVPVGLHDEYLFSIESRDGKITFIVNGIIVCEDYTPAPREGHDYGPIRLAEDGFVGFAQSRWCAQNVTTFDKVEVRRLR